MTNIDVINQKLDSHIENQEKINNRITDNLEKLTETASDIKVFQAELNNIREDLTDQKQMTQIISDRLVTVESQSDKNTDLRKDQKHIKMVLITAVIGAVITFGASMFTGDKSISLSPETIKQIRASQ